MMNRFIRSRASSFEPLSFSAIENALTERQRTVFVAVAVDHLPMDAVASKLEVNRNAIYKAMFDARRKIRAYLVANDFIS